MIWTFILFWLSYLTWLCNRLSAGPTFTARLLSIDSTNSHIFLCVLFFISRNILSSLFGFNAIFHVAVDPVPCSDWLVLHLRQRGAGRWLVDCVRTGPRGRGTRATEKHIWFTRAVGQRGHASSGCPGTKPPPLTLSVYSYIILCEILCEFVNEANLFYV